MSDANLLGALATLFQDGLHELFGDHSPRAAAILITLLNRGAMTISNIAEITSVSQPTATRVIDGLERNGAVQRRARQGRVVVVALTRRGRKKAEQFQTARANFVRGLTDTLSPEERKYFAKLVGKILFAATTSRAFARTTCRYCDHSICNGNHCPINRRASEIEQNAALRN